MAFPILAVGAGAALVGATGYGLYLLASRRAGDSLPQLPPPGQGGTKPLGPGSGGDKPAQEPTIEDFIGRFPNGGIHETRSGNSLSAVASGVLNEIDPGAGNDPAMVRAYKKILNTSDFNRELFGVRDPSVKDNSDGWHIQLAFLGRHEDTANVMRAGIMPERQIDSHGEALPGSPHKWGDIWAVRLQPGAVKARITDPDLLVAPNYDGSSGLNPPLALLQRLQVRA